MEPLFISVPNAYKDLESELVSVSDAAYKAGFTALNINFELTDEADIVFRCGQINYSISSVSESEYKLTKLGSGEVWTLVFTSHVDTLTTPEGARVSTDWSGKGLTSSTIETLLGRIIVALALEYLVEDAFLLARALGSVSCETWPNHIDHFPKLATTIKSPVVTRKASKCSRLYPVVDSIELIEELVKLDLDIVQLRIKDKQPVEVEADIQRAVELGKAHNVDVVINDYWQTALDSDAACIHLGQEDLQSLSSSALLESNIGLGISTHGYYEILNALQYKPSYLALGHIFPTPTKDMPSSPQGLTKLGFYQSVIDSIERAHGISLPTVAIGGIDDQRAPRVIKTGVDSVAVVRAVTQADDRNKAVQQFQTMFKPEVATC